MAGLTGAQLLAQALRAGGVDLVFALSGNQILPVLDACLDQGLRVLDTRHESAAVHMADAAARLTGRPSVCLVAAGPGHTNALTGLGTAMLAESPVLLLSGGSERAGADIGVFQELDQAGMAAPISKAALIVERPEQIPDLVTGAFRTMLGGRPGPVSLTLPANVQTARVDPVATIASGAFEPLGRPGDPRTVERAVGWLAQAERPLVLGGPAESRGAAGRAFKAFLEASGVPGFVLESPRGLSDPALHGLGSSFREADLVLLFARQDYAVGFARPAVLAEQGRLIQVGSRLENLGRNRAADLGLVGDSAVVLGQLLEAFAPPRGWRRRVDDWSNELARRRAAERARLAQAETSDERPLHPLRVCAAVRARLQSGDVVALDGGEFGQWARWAFGDAPQRVLLNGKFGMIGCGLPFALGVKVSGPEARVVAFVGDGAFGFQGFELDTAVRHGLPVVVVVGNDAGWATERHRQRALFGPERLVASDLLPTRYDLVAQGLGADGVLVEEAAALGPAIDQALANNRTTCVNVAIASIPSPSVRSS
jgi:acetolactate synthase-1/2/3 large subunit